ncbi:MAG: NFACT family protein [Metallosphaera sp.]
MSYIDLVAWLAENRERLVGCRIDNIFATNLQHLYIFVIHCHNGDSQLVIQPGKRVHFTKFNHERLLDSKAKMLRELIRGELIEDVDVVNGERILRMKLKDKIVYIELLPKGTLIVTDNDNRIKFALEQREFKDRTLKPGELYVLPPSPTELKPNEVESYLKKGALSRVLGVPQEFLNILSINANNLDELEDAKKKLGKVMQDIQRGVIQPCVDLERTVWPVRFPGCTELPSYNEALDNYFTSLEKAELEKLVDEGEEKKLEATISKLKETLTKMEEEAETLRKKGKAIMNNYLEVEEKIKEGVKEIEIEGLKIEIDPKISASKNASQYFEKAKELDAKIRRTRETIEELEKKKQEIKAKSKEIIEGSKILVRKKEWYEKYHWTITSNGFIVIAGRDIDQNESIVRKMLEDRDIFMHADIQGAPATVIKNPVGIGEQDLMDAAVLAGCYSKAWKVGLASIDVFWVYGEQVSKSPPSGEYLPKGSFMIYGKKNYIKNVKLELTIGVNVESDYRIEVGSFEAISKRCKVFVTITPGDSDPEKLGDRISRIFARELGVDGVKALKDEIVRIIPGKSKIKGTTQQLANSTGLNLKD